MRIYNRALSEDEIMKVYGEGTQSGLVGWWKFDESAGTTAEDAIGTNDGTFAGGSGGPVWQPTGGKIAGGLQFDNTHDHLTLASRDFGNTFSVSLWANIDTTGDNIVTLISNKPSGFEANGLGLIINRTTGFMHLETGDGTTGNSARGPWPTDGVWNHIVVTADRANGRARLYVNGNDITVDDTIRTDFNTVGVWYLLGANASGTGGSSPGTFDDVRLHNRILTPDEIRLMYTTCRNPDGYEGEITWNANYAVPQYCDGTQWVAMRPPRVDPGGLLAWWKLDEASGTIASDSSGNALSGTTVNGPAWQAGTGKIGGALSFNGTSQYVETGSAPSWYSPGAMVNKTLSVWVKFSYFPTIGNSALLAKGGGSPNCFTLIALWDATGTATPRFDINNANLSSSVPIINGDTAWHHLAVTISDSTVRIYLDGIETGSMAYPGHTDATPTQPFSLGARFSGGLGVGFYPAHWMMPASMTAFFQTPKSPPFTQSATMPVARTPPAPPG